MQAVVYVIDVNKGNKQVIATQADYLDVVAISSVQRVLEGLGRAIDALSNKQRDPSLGAQEDSIIASQQRVRYSSITILLLGPFLYYDNVKALELQLVDEGILDIY